MPQPTPYTQATDFSQDEANNVAGRSTVDTSALDAEFSAISATLGETLSNLAMIQRDDGALADTSVTVATLSRSVLNLIGGFTVRGEWAAATAYAVNDIVSEAGILYLCQTAHTSPGAFVEAPNWTHFGFAGSEDAAIAAAQAAASASAASASATAASASQAAAAASQSSASSSALTASSAAAAAGTSAGNAAASATNASNSAVAAAASAASITLPVPVASGGTGQTTASAALTALGGASATTLAASGGSNTVGFIQSGTGAMARTVQDKLREFASDADYSSIANYITARVGNQHYVQNGARVQRFTDRVLIGHAAKNDGRFPNVSQDWMTQYQIAAGLPNGTIVATVAAVLNAPVSGSSVGLICGSQSLDFTSADSSCIGGMDFAVNNHATLATKAWARYGEVHKQNAVCGPVYATEYDTRTLVASISPHPWQQGDVVGHQIGSGCGLSATGQFDASAAHQIVANPMQFKVGINFMHDSIDGTDGTSGLGKAIAFANFHAVQWHNASGSVMGEIYSTSATEKRSIRMTSDGIVFLGTSDQTLGVVLNINSAVNYINLVPNISGAAVQLLVSSSADSNVDMWLRPLGTGVVRFGTWTSNGDAAVNGYITVKDSGGATRKLATIA